MCEALAIGFGAGPSRGRARLPASALTRATIASLLSRVRGRGTSSPASAQPNSLMFSGSMPANQSKSAVSYGTMPTMQRTNVARSGNLAATASAWGPPPRSTDDHELVDSFGVGNRLDVGDTVDHPASGITIRSAVARAVIRDDTRADIRQRLVVRIAIETTARSAVQAEDRCACGVAPLRVAELPTVVGAEHGRLSLCLLGVGGLENEHRNHASGLALVLALRWIRGDSPIPPLNTLVAGDFARGHVSFVRAVLEFDDALQGHVVDSTMQQVGVAKAVSWVPALTGFTASPWSRISTTTLVPVAGAPGRVRGPRVRTCACAPARAHLPVRTCPCAPARAHLPVRTCPCAPARAHLPVRTYPCAPTRAHLPVRTYPYAPTRTHPRIRACAHASAGTCIHVRACAHVHAYACLNVRGCRAYALHALVRVHLFPGVRELYRHNTLVLTFTHKQFSLPTRACRRAICVSADR